MNVALRPELSADGQAMLDEVTVRLICPVERAAFDQLLIQEHDLKKAELVGEHLR